MSLTPEQIDEMVAESAPMVPWEDRRCWFELSAKQEECFRWLMPNPCFTDEQRFWLGKWVLPVDTETLDELNGLMPPNNVIAPRVAEDETLWINADLLSDALDDRRLSAALPVLGTLPLTYVHTIVWPQPEDDHG